MSRVLAYALRGQMEESGARASVRHVYSLFLFV
jgi:hypothetical protein